MCRGSAARTYFSVRIMHEDRRDEYALRHFEPTYGQMQPFRTSSGESIANGNYRFLRNP